MVSGLVTLFTFLSSKRLFLGGGLGSTQAAPPCRVFGAPDFGMEIFNQLVASSKPTRINHRPPAFHQSRPDFLSNLELPVVSIRLIQYQP